MSNIPGISEVQAKYLSLFAETPMTTRGIHDKHFPDVQLKTSIHQVNMLVDNKLIWCVEEVSRRPKGGKAKVYATTRLGLEAIEAMVYEVKCTTTVQATSMNGAIEKADSDVDRIWTFSARRLKT